MKNIKKISKAVDKFYELKDHYVSTRLPSLTNYEIASQILRPFESHLMSEVNYNNEDLLNLRNTLSETIDFTGCSYHNSLKLFIKGEDFFSEMWDMIDNAQERIWLETYIFANDFVGMKTVEKLEDAASRGVEVIFLMDAFGSMFATWSNKKFVPLYEKGGYVYEFNKPFTQLFLKMMFGEDKYHSPALRDHRKLLIVDDVGYIGGMNIENLYGDFHCEEDFLLGKTSLSEEELKNNFRDTQLRIIGESIAYLETCFLETLEDCTPMFKYEDLPQKLMSERDFTFPTKEELEERKQSLLKEVNEPKGYHIKIIPTEDEVVEEGNIKEEEETETESKETKGSAMKEHEDLFVQIVKSNPKRGRRKLQKSVYSIIDASSKYLYITTPYFIPGRRLDYCLKNAAERGVEIKVLTSGRSDVPLYVSTARNIYGEYLKYPNFEIYEYTEKLMHSKSFVMDGVFSSIGSYNFDRGSFLVNMEIGAHIYNTDFSKEMEDIYFKDLENAKKVTMEDLEERSLLEKFSGKLAYAILKSFIK